MHILIALVLQATTPDAVAPVQTPPTETTQPAAAVQPLEPEMVCRWEVPPGQRLRRRVCREIADIEATADASSEAARHMQEIRGGSYLDDEMIAGGMRP